MQQTCDGKLLVSLAAQNDRDALTRWESHLLPLQQGGWLTFRSERALQAGEERLTFLTTWIDQAQIIVLLLSADFFASEECMALLAYARSSPQQAVKQLIPLVVRPVFWQDSPLGGMACLPANALPISRWEDEDEGWHACVQGLLPFLKHPPTLPHASLSDKRDRSSRATLLRLLRCDYQRDQDESLERLAWLELGLAEHPHAVYNATHLSHYRSDQSARALPAGTSILHVYDEAEEALLILGDPGAGKSTLLRELALHLVTRAQADEAHPLPVIFPLSSWASSRASLAAWMEEQLVRIYAVPREMARHWTRPGLILPLLDGLDEMEEQARPLCIAAINAYHQAFTPLVVCSRTAEYQDASTCQRLALQNAVCVQPLTRSQVTWMIEQVGISLASLSQLLSSNQEVYNLATTPLMLSVLILAYHDLPPHELPQSSISLEQQIWADYIRRMVREKGEARPGSLDTLVRRYSLPQVYAWLGWLAQEMRAHNQTLFYGEILLQDWLPAPLQRRGVWLGVYFPVLVLGTCACLWLDSFLALLYGLDVFATGNPVAAGLLGGFLGWCVCRGLDRPVSAVLHPPGKKRWLRRQARSLLQAGGISLLAALSFGLRLNGSPYTLSDWLHDGGHAGGCLLLATWLLQAILPHPPSSASASAAASPRVIASLWLRLANWLRTPPVRQALWTLILLGMFRVVDDALDRGEIGPGEGIWFSYGLVYGGAIYLARSTVEGQTGMVRLMERVSWTGRRLLQLEHLRASFLVVLAGFCFFTLTYGMTDGVSFFEGDAGSRVSLALRDGAGLGLTLGLLYWLLLGLYQGLSQKRLEEKDRRHFNQGIHLSLRKSIPLSLVSAGIITGAGLLSYPLIAEISFALSTAPGNWYALWLPELNDRTPSVWLTLLCSWVVLWIFTGGLSILRHYILRVLLARYRTFPLDSRRFLDDACARVLLKRVGGGYGFVHRRLLDYFADASLLAPRRLPTPETSLPPDAMSLSSPALSSEVLSSEAEPKKRSF